MREPWGAIGHQIHDLAVATVQMIGTAGAVAEWIVTAGLDAIFGLARITKGLA